MRSLRARVAKYVRNQVVFPASLGMPLGAYLLHRPLPFSLWVHARRVVNRLRRGGVRTLEGAASAHLADQVIPYSRRKAGRVFRDRTERLMNVLRSIQGLAPARMRVLTIGSRNEAEILLLRLHGFRARNIVAIDLVSESPLIRVMDMHELALDDGAFDLVYSAYTVAYSDDVPRACAEMLRVVRDGGLVAISFLHSVGGVNAFGENPLSGGLSELLGHFGEHVEHVYWREEFPAGDVVLCSTVFRVRK
jgi:SAM-dependent methyltransferase